MGMVGINRENYLERGNHHPELEKMDESKKHFGTPLALIMKSKHLKVSLPFNYKPFTHSFLHSFVPVY